MIPFFGTLVKGVCKDVLHMSDEAAGTLGLLAGICALDPSVVAEILGEAAAEAAVEASSACCAGGAPDVVNNYYNGPVQSQVQVNTTR